MPGWRRSLSAACVRTEPRSSAGLHGERSTFLRPRPAARRSQRCSMRVRFFCSSLPLQCLVKATRAAHVCRATPHALKLTALGRAGAGEGRLSPWSAEAAADEFLQAHQAEAGPLMEYRKNRFSGVYRKVLRCGQAALSSGASCRSSVCWVQSAA